MHYKELSRFVSPVSTHTEAPNGMEIIHRAPIGSIHTDIAVSFTFLQGCATCHASSDYVRIDGDPLTSPSRKSSGRGVGPEDLR